MKRTLTALAITIAVLMALLATSAPSGAVMSSNRWDRSTFYIQNDTPSVTWMTPAINDAVTYISGIMYNATFHIAPCIEWQPCIIIRSQDGASDPRPAYTQRASVGCVTAGKYCRKGNPTAPAGYDATRVYFHTNFLGVQSAATRIWYARHELGHALSLEHASDSVMNGSVCCGGNTYSATEIPELRQSMVGLVAWQPDYRPGGYPSQPLVPAGATIS